MSSEEVAGAAAIELHDDLDARETVAVAASLAAFFLGIVYWVSRIGFDNPALPVVTAVGVSLFLCCAPMWVIRIARWRQIGAGQWWMSHPVVTLLVIVLTTLLAMLSSATGAQLGLVLGVPGAVLTLWTMYLWVQRGRVLASVLFVVGTAWFTAWAAGVAWGSRYKMPLFRETFGLTANVHHDPLYNVGIGNMLDTYGIPSIGLDGLAPIRYHYGSAWLYAQLSHLIGTDVLTFYSLGYPIIFVPLFFAALLLLAVEIRRSMAPAPERPLRTDWRMWSVFAAAAIGLVPVKALFGLAIWNGNFLLSESYLAGLPVFLLVIAAGVAFYRTDAYRALVPTIAVETEVETDPGDTKVSALFLVAFLPAALLALGFLKVSLMLLLLPLVLYSAYRMDVWKRSFVPYALALCVLVTILTYPAVALSSQNGGLSPFSFMRYHIAAGWEQFFPLLNLMWSWIYIAGRMWEERINNTRELGNAIRRNRIFDVEIVFLVALLGFLPGELIAIHGGSAFYFSDVQRWVALAFIAARIGAWMRKWRAIREARAQRLPHGWRGIRLSTLLAVFVAAPFAVTMLLNSIYWPLKAGRTNVALRTTIASKGGGGLITDPGPLNRGLAKTDYYPIAAALRKIGNLPSAERRRSGIFIPQSYGRYWRMFDFDERCTYVSFVAPAMAGVAMIDGMPPKGCVLTDQYNLVRYNPRMREQQPEDMSPGALCMKARAEHFSQVIVLSPDSAGNPRTSRIPCTG